MITTKRYRILGLEIVLSSDCETFMEGFDMDYALFAAQEAPVGRCLPVAYLEGTGEGAVLSLDGASRSLGESSNPADHAYQMVMAMLMKEIRGFFILHGAVVARDGHALVISGPSGSGKTTLVTALLGAGFQLLSDDFCPLDEETRLVHPFPRTMWRVARDGEPAQGRVSVKPGGRTVRGGKVPVDLDSMKARVASGPYKVGGLIYIDSGPAEDQWWTTRVRIEKRGEETLLAAAAGMKGITVEKLPGRASGWEIRYRKREGHARNALAILKAVEPYTLRKSRVESHSPDFSRDPSLTPVQCHEMAHQLLKELKSEPDGLRVKPGEYFMKLIGLLSDVSCWRLTTGKLDKMKDLAISTLGKRALLKEMQ